MSGAFFKRFKIPILFLLLVEILLLLFFPPSLVFEPTLTAGGDTPSHFFSALVMRDKLLTPFSPVTWVYGAYAGFPLFLHYFPLPFVLMAILSFAVSLLVAFKLVTLLAIIPLPLALYYSLRRLGYTGWTPALGAVLSLLFLFMSDNSMWGGNICSTLAGEFAFGISFILYVVYTGKLYSDLPERKSLFTNSLIEALIALSSGYPLLQAGMGTSFFIPRGRNIRYILILHAAAFGLAGFWLVPLLWRVAWDTPFIHSWSFKSWSEPAPPILWPAIAGALICLAASLRTLLKSVRTKSPVPPLEQDGDQPAAANISSLNPEHYLWWQFFVALLGFSLAPSIGLVDIRFLPFAQITVVMLGAIGWGKVLVRLPRPSLCSAVFCAGVIAFAITRAATVDSWIQWNYSGFESKPLWNSYRLVNQYLAGDQNSPRVVYEHSEITNSVGTIRAFEMLPYYSGRSTLEGLYMQSSPTSPFVFYIQSELTEIPSCPFSGFYYSRPDPDRAAAHLRLFNVSQVITASDNISNALDSSPDYELQIVFPPYRIYRLTHAADSYVEPILFQPFRISPSGWKARQFEWFRKSSLHVPLIMAADDSPGDYAKTLPIYDGPPETIPEIPISVADAANTHAEAVLGDGTITVTTSHPGQPLWIKISYHPDWKVTEGSGELYAASPVFMLLVPKSTKVVLSFDTHGGLYLWARIITLLTVVSFVCAHFIRRQRRRQSRAADSADGPEIRYLRPSRVFTNFLFLAATIISALVIVICLFTRNHRDPVLLYDYAAGKFEAANQQPQQPAAAEAAPKVFEETPSSKSLLALFDECIAKFGHSSVMDHCISYKARLLADAGRWDDVRSIMEDFLEANPDTRIYAEATVFLGEASLGMGDREHAEQYFQKALLSWPENDVTRQAGLRLAELAGPDVALEKGESLLASGNYLQAYVLLRALTFHTDAEIRDRSTLCLAYCCFNMNRWEEASSLLLQWLNGHFDSPESSEVQATLRQIQVIIAQNKLWCGEPDGSSSTTPKMGWLLRLFKRDPPSQLSPQSP